MDPTETYQAAWESEGLRQWFHHHCEKKDDCPAYHADKWVFDKDGHVRCAQCRMKA